MSYWLGRTFGMKLIHGMGEYVRITEEHVHKAHAWFERVGHWGLTFGYFVPGVRHLTAYAAGMSEVAPHQFAVFAYSGGVPLGGYISEPWLFSGRALGGGGEEHPPVSDVDYDCCRYCAACDTGRGGSGTGRKVSDQQRGGHHHDAADHVIPKVGDAAVEKGPEDAASPASMPTNVAVPPTRRKPNASTKQPSSDP